MCLVAIARTRISGRRRLLLAANRDEFHERPAQPVHWWPDAPAVAAGRDDRGGGTWLGVRRDGHFAAVLNAPGVAPAGAPSRGGLVLRYLCVEGFSVAAMAARASDYAGFHCLAGNVDGVGYVGRDVLRHDPWEDDIIACGNAGLDAPGPRVERLRGAMRNLMAVADPVPGLLQALAEETPCAPGTGDTRPVFIHDAGFGTRCSSVICIDGHSGRFRERSFAASGTCIHDRTLHWRLDARP